jgi:hypothetical protein
MSAARKRRTTVACGLCYRPAGPDLIGLRLPPFLFACGCSASPRRALLLKPTSASTAPLPHGCRSLGATDFSGLKTIFPNPRAWDRLLAHTHACMCARTHATTLAHMSPHTLKHKLDAMRAGFHALVGTSITSMSSWSQHTLRRHLSLVSSVNVMNAKTSGKRKTHHHLYLEVSHQSLSTNCGTREVVSLRRSLG